MNMWQALFSKTKNLSPKKHRKKNASMGWQGWTVIIGAILVGAALAIFMADLASKQKTKTPAEEPAPAEEESEG